MSNVMRNFESFDVNQLQFTNPKVNQSGGQSVYINYNNDKLRIQTPTMFAPFGVNEYNGRCSIDMSVRDPQFQKFIEDLDKTIIDNAVKSSNSWFKKNLNESVVNELYKNTLKGNSEKYPPLLRMKLPTQDGEFVGEIYDANENLIATKALSRGMKIQVIAELVGIYFVSKEFGLSWKILQVKLYPSNKLSGFSFVDDNDDAEPV